MQKEIRLYLITYSIYEIARTIPHAFVTMYLLNASLNISQITLAQTFFMLAIILLEIPSGILCDKYNKKHIFIISCIFMIASYGIYAFVSTLGDLIIAQLLYGTAMSLKSGSIDCIIYNRLHKEQIEKIDDFVRWNNLAGTISMISGASIGFILYTYFCGKYVYLLAVTFFVISSIICTKMQPEYDLITNSKITLSDIKAQFKYSIKILLSNKKVFYFVSIMGYLQFMEQPLYNYWQPISIKAGIEQNHLLFVYIAVQIVNIFALFLYKKVSMHRSIESIIKKCLFIEVVLTICGLLCKDISYILIMLLIIIPRIFISLKTNAEFQKHIENDSRSTLTSISSFYCRVFSIVVLFLISGLSLVIGNLIIIFSLCLLISCILILFIIKKYGENE